MTSPNSINPGSTLKFRPPYCLPRTGIIVIPALLALPLFRAAALNTEDNVLSTGGELSSGTSYSSTPTAPGTASDVTFTTTTTYGNPGGFTLNSGNLSIGTLNDLNTSQAIVVTGTKTLTLNGGTDSVAGSTPGDLIYVAGGASLSGSAPTAFATTLTSGTIDNDGTISFNVGGAYGTSASGDQLLSNANVALTFNGTGATTLSGVMTFGSTTSGTTVLNDNSSAPVSLGTIYDTGLNGSIQFNTAAGSSMTIAGIRGTGSTGGSTLTFGGSGSVTLTSGTAINGSTYTGALLNGAAAQIVVVQNGGTVTLAGASAAGSTNSTAASGNTYALNSGTLALNAANALGGVLTISGGSLDNTSGGTIASGQAGNQINADFNWVGSNSLTLSGTSVLGGAGSARTITSAGTGVLNLSGAISGTSGLTLAGSGIVALTSGASTYSGGLTLNGGEVRLNTASAPGSGTFTINGGSINNTVGSTVTATNTVMMNGDVNWVGANGLTLSGSTALGGSGTARTITTAGTGVLTFSGPVSSAGGLGLTFGGNGIAVLSASNSFSGGVTLSGAELRVNNANALGSGTFTINSGTVNNTGGGALTAANAVVMAGNFNWTGNTHSLTLSGPIALTGPVGITTNGNTGSLNLSGAISGGNTAGLSVAGNGTVVLSNSNSFSGGVTLNSGGLKVGNSYALGAGVFTVNAGTLDNSTAGFLQINPASTVLGGNFNWAGSESLTIANSVSLSPVSGTTVTITTAGTTLAFSGNISSASGAGLIVAGSGQLSLYGANTYSGGVTVNSGQLNVNGSSALGSGTFTINGGGLNESSNAVGLISAANSVVIGNGFNWVGSNPLILSGPVSLVGTSHTVTTAGSSALTLSGAISGSNGFAVAGTGTVQLGGTSNFSGGTAVNQGVLLVTGSLAGTVSVSGTFGGAGGRVGDLVTINNNGVLEPGVGETTRAGALLTLNNGLTMSGTSTLVINLDNSNNVDALAVTGNISLGTNDTLTVNLLNGAAPAQPSYIIATYTGSLGGAAGTFANINAPNGYTVAYNVPDGGGDAIELELTAVPEPGALGLAFSGLGLFAGLQRLRRRKRIV